MGRENEKYQYFVFLYTDVDFIPRSIVLCIFLYYFYVYHLVVALLNVM